jgi:hypothetical protein
MMFAIHYKHSEGSRPGQALPLCEANTDQRGGSDGQCGDNLASTDIEETTCAYCTFEYLKSVDPHLGEENHIPLVHWSVHPVFKHNGITGVLDHWAASCGLVDIENEHVMASRDMKEITCNVCLDVYDPAKSVCPPFEYKD